MLLKKVLCCIFWGKKTCINGSFLVSSIFLVEICRFYLDLNWIYQKRKCFNGLFHSFDLLENSFDGFHVSFSPISLRIFAIQNFLQIRGKFLAALSMGTITNFFWKLCRKISAFWFLIESTFFCDSWFFLKFLVWQNLFSHLNHCL